MSASQPGLQLTDRLRLEPIGPEHAEDLWLLHQDAIVAEWYGGAWTEEEAESFATRCGEGWRRDGVSKWIAYDRETAELVGRGGLSRLTEGGSQATQIAALVDPSWAPQRLELGWAILRNRQRKGYAAEIGRAGLRYAGSALDASTVIAFTEIHNFRSRAVMERIGMLLAGTIKTTGLVEGEACISDQAPFAVYVTH